MMRPWLTPRAGFQPKRSSRRPALVTKGDARHVVDPSNRHVHAPANNDLLNIADWIAERAGTDVAQSYVERREHYCLGFELAGERGQ
jgi:hypothetical protein